jgi:hypothetical protein
VIGDRGVGVEQALAVDVLERKIPGSIFHGAAPDCMLAGTVTGPAGGHHRKHRASDVR